MPDKMTYQERWQELANEYAIAHGNGDLGVHRINIYYEKDARMAVAAQAEAIREFSKQMWEDEYTSDVIRSENTLDHITDMFLLEHGYIEPKTITQTHNVVSSETQRESVRINCQRCKKRTATDKYSDLDVCDHCCKMLNDEFDE